MVHQVPLKKLELYPQVTAGVAEHWLVRQVSEPTVSSGKGRGWEWKLGSPIRMEPPVQEDRKPSRGGRVGKFSPTYVTQGVVRASTCEADTM